MNNATILTKLLNVQHKLKSPKNQMNNFGKYRYRSCEDILEAVKPLLFEESLVLTLTDEIIPISVDFYTESVAEGISRAQKEFIYVKAIASVLLEEKSVSVQAFAREPLTKKGMDDSQITGAASSYARKYALNGLFLIDDTKDADADIHESTGRLGSPGVEIVPLAKKYDTNPPHVFFLNKMKEARDFGELEAAFKQAIIAVKVIKDVKSEAEIISLKDELKKKLYDAQRPN